MEQPEIWFFPTFNDEPSDEDLESYLFEFDVAAHFVHVPDQDDDHDFLSDIPCTTCQDTFMVERGADEESFRAYVTRELEDLGVPSHLQPYIVDRIFNEAKSIERDESFLDRKVIRMRVLIDIVVNNHDEAFNFDGDDGDVDAAMVPASKSSIESLERVNVEGSNTECSICLEKISARLEAIRLPCSHVYHGQCIRTWLEKSGNCPLCRFVI